MHAIRPKRHQPSLCCTRLSTVSRFGIVLNCYDKPLLTFFFLLSRVNWLPSSAVGAPGMRSRRRLGVSGRTSGGAAWSRLAPIAKHKKVPLHPYYGYLIFSRVILMVYLFKCLQRFCFARLVPTVMPTECTKRDVMRLGGQLLVLCGISSPVGHLSLVM